MDSLDELIDFLSTSNPEVYACMAIYSPELSTTTMIISTHLANHNTMQVKKQAVLLVQGLTGSPEGISQLASRKDTLVPSLFRLVGDGEELSRPALISLVNLAQEPTIQKKLLDLNAVSRCMDYLKDNISKGNEDLLVMLLANMTAEEEGARSLLQIGKGAMEGLNASLLIQRFLSPSVDNSKDPYEHVATILPNVTRLQEGRQVLMEPGKGTLRALASQLRSASVLRRRGCAGAIKNCCFSCEEDDTVDAVCNEKDALRDVTDVLCGISTKEEDDSVRIHLAEAILCLAKVELSRKVLWELNVPELLQKGYEGEECHDVCEAMESTAEFFLQDGFEPENGGDDGVGSGGRPDVQIEEID